MKYLLYLATIIITTLSCNNPEQNSAAGNSADVRDSSARTNPNTDVDDSTSNKVSSDSSHHH